MYSLRMMLLVALSFGLTHCGGGSGGGDNNSTLGEDDIGVRVVHGGLEISPVEYTSSSDTSVLIPAQFLKSSVYRQFPAGAQTLSLFRANSGGSRFVTSLSFTTTPATRYTVLLYGDQTDLGPRAKVFIDTAPALEETQAAVRFLNGVDNSAAVLIGDTEVPFGGASSYEVLESGSFSFAVSRKADGLPLANRTINVEAQKAYSIIIAGEADIFVGLRVLTDS